MARDVAGAADARAGMTGGRAVGARFGVALAFVLCALLVLSAQLGVSEAAGAGLPEVDREAAERSFLKAYDYFIQNRLWDSLDNLRDALEHNVYFVDAYYMRALAQRRLGRYTDAMKSMSEYLEVRRDDFRGRMILDTMKLEWDILNRTLEPEGMDAGLAFFSHNLNSFLNVPVYAPVSSRGMQGIGKIGSSGSLLFVCDTFGDKVWIFNRSQKRAPAGVPAYRPVAVVPMNAYESLLFQKDGGVLRLRVSGELEDASLEPVGSVRADAADAAFIDSTYFAVADRIGGRVRFYGMPSMGETAVWHPADAGGKLFEPVATASYGPLLAVADRGNERVYVLDSYTLSVLDRIDVEMPRDLEWGNQGELYIVSENGTLYSHFPSGIASPDLKPVSAGMKDAWSMTWTGKGPVVSSVSGRSWWVSRLNPGHKEALGAITLHDPWIETVDGTEMLMLRGAASSTFHDFIRDRTPNTQVVWRGEVRPSRVTEISSGNDGVTRFYSPTTGMTSLGDRIARASSINDVMADIAGMSRVGEPMPKVIVLDTRVTGSDGQLSLFMAFLLQQGIRLDLWAIGRPAPRMLCRISRITLGNTYYSRALEVVPFNDSIEWVLSVPLPPDVDTYGYPSDTTLTLFSTVDIIRFTDWLPIWPPLINRKQLPQ
ncbi:MAG: hypothetical protein LBS75_03410 [Synergistaceae bacterium]|nr:hypothetical protein [Synergistaceae bacterium]